MSFVNFGCLYIFSLIFKKEEKIELGPICYCVSLPEFLSTTLLEDFGKVSKTAKRIILKDILQTSLSKLNFHNPIESA